MKQNTSLVVPAKGGEATSVRLPKGVLRQLNIAAAYNGRSRNSEIAFRLVESLKQKKAA